jgi:hypothetical protein
MQTIEEIKGEAFELLTKPSYMNKQITQQLLMDALEEALQRHIGEEIVLDDDLVVEVIPSAKQ